MTEKEISRQITRYIKGELNEQEEDLLWIEFLKNPEYYELFETELNLADLYQNKNFRVDESSNRVQEPRRRYIAWSFAAAATILLASLIYLFTFQHESGPASYALSEIELTEMLGSDIYRDDRSDSAELDQQINRSLSLALEGNSSRSYQILRSLLQERLSNIQELRILYNLGILAYNDGDYNKAIEHFSAIENMQYADTPGYILENTNWYTANIYLKKNEIRRATTLLEIISTGDGVHSGNAEQLLNKIE